jgi:hypothetical protein
MSHDPDEISRAFKKHCSKCGAWNQVIVHRMPTDGDWDEAHPISVLTAVTNSTLNAASVFQSRRIEISDSHTNLSRSADIPIFRLWTRLCKILKSRPFMHGMLKSASYSTTSVEQTRQA